MFLGRVAKMRRINRGKGDAQNEGSPFYTWSNQVIAEGISTDGVGINAITLAELSSAARADSEKVFAAAALVQSLTLILSLCERERRIPNELEMTRRL